MVVLIAFHHRPSTKIITEVLHPEILEIKSGYAITPIAPPVPPIKHIKCERSKPCLALAEAIYYEGRGESIAGQIAIGWVVMNRKASDKFKADTVSGVINTRCQFSYKCDGSMRNGIANKVAWGTSLMVAEGIKNGVFADPTNGADHYLNPKAVKTMPRWTQVYPKIASIGNHDFYVWK